MFDGFDLVRRDAGSTGFRVRIGGSGPAVLLLHGHPQTHVMWHAVAPRMARSHTPEWARQWPCEEIWKARKAHP